MLVTSIIKFNDDFFKFNDEFYNDVMIFQSDNMVYNSYNTNSSVVTPTSSGIPVRKLVIKI
jgi:hypothetical protein